jgi:hypothetical protein
MSVDVEDALNLTLWEENQRQMDFSTNLVSVFLQL